MDFEFAFFRLDGFVLGSFEEENLHPLGHVSAVLTAQLAAVTTFPQGCADEHRSATRLAGAAVHPSRPSNPHDSARHRAWRTQLHRRHARLTMLVLTPGNASQTAA